MSRVSGATVEQSSTVAPPAWLHAARRGHLPLSGHLWKCLDVDFVSSRFIRRIREPPTVRRQLSLNFIKGAVQDGEWLPFAIIGNAQMSDADCGVCVL